MLPLSASAPHVCNVQAAARHSASARAAEENRRASAARAAQEQQQRLQERAAAHSDHQTEVRLALDHRNLRSSGQGAAVVLILLA